MLSPFRFRGFALSCTVPAHLRFALPAVRYSMEHTFDYTVTLFSPSATSISGLYLLWPLLTSHSSLLLRRVSPPVRPHGISLPVYLPDLRTWVTVAFWTSLSTVSLSAMYALYQVSVRQATISLSLLLACTSRYKPWESLWGSSATTPLVDFHHRLTACPSYTKSQAEWGSLAYPAESI